MKEKFDFNEATVLYKNNKIRRNEWLLISALSDNKKFIKSFMRGDGEYKLYYDSQVDESLYFTNVESLLDAFYILYKKFPNESIDKILENELLDLSVDEFYIYEFITIVFTQVLNEKKGISPFKINNKKLLSNCKENINKYQYALSKNKMFVGGARVNGQLDVIKEYNESFKNTIGYDLFSIDEINGSKSK